MLQGLPSYHMDEMPTWEARARAGRAGWGGFNRLRHGGCWLHGGPSPTPPPSSAAAMHTWGRFMSCSFSPVAYSMAWEAPWLLGCVMRELYLLRPAGRREAGWRMAIHADDAGAKLLCHALGAPRGAAPCVLARRQFNGL